VNRPTVGVLEDFTIESMADMFVQNCVSPEAPPEQKRDMKVAFIAGVATLGAYQRRLQREAPDRIDRLLAAREQEINELCLRYGMDGPTRRQ
jgi:hypothetical protein